MMQVGCSTKETSERQPVTLVMLKMNRVYGEN